MVTPFLAQLVSIIDRDFNLDLLLDTHSDESLKKLWLKIFGDVKLLNVPYTSLKNKYVVTVVIPESQCKIDVYGWLPKL